MEGLHACAYKDQPLGRPHLCPVENVGNITADTLQQFRAAHFTADRMVVAGAGIEHEKLLELADKYFGHLTVPPATNADATGNVIPGSEASLYTGGECHQPTGATIDGLTRIAVAFELSGGWNELEGDLVPACVLQVLLGGGSSFSAGGPGKGMYSRLYREVLNRYYWVEAAEAFTSFHSESGLLGIKGACPGVKSLDLTRLFCEHMAKLAMFPVTDEELDRAKNMLKCNVLTQLESRLVLFEDIGRQILTYGKREGIGRTCERIDAVTKDDIMNIAKKALNKPPSISAVGEQQDLANVPTFDEVNGWFRGS
uniref:Peptidase M16 C-terminal domain-containing protein n=1 Tax=Leptocylindrus danicus TaxID=163516 RepID=A0A7S2PHG5_9STRA|mmetsp:Transcript_33759/g.48884  ORF Transcript_33759/g.48884 Transcript_33759/m.48884 type:complete len:312 (+) Transcript_33759:1-936(+)